MEAPLKAASSTDELDGFIIGTFDINIDSPALWVAVKQWSIEAEQSETNTYTDRDTDWHLTPQTIHLNSHL